MLTKAQGLAGAGQHAALVDYLHELPDDRLRQSPTLALFMGTGLGRLGDLATGRGWIETALERARESGDQRIEARALNVLGAIAFEGGAIETAADWFTKGLACATRLGDSATVGRCSNNLGIIANLRGNYPRAVGQYTIALAAFERAAMEEGIAETQHNLGITYRDNGQYERALEAAEHAVIKAEAVGNKSLLAKAWAGRAETRVLCGDARMARREAETALTMHREIKDVVGETEDLRILAATVCATGDRAGAERLLRTVIERAEGHGRPLLIAMASQDLAKLLLEAGRVDEARGLARTARATFDQLGAEAEIRKLDQLFAS